MLIDDPTRLATAAGLLLAYAGLCRFSWRRNHPVSARSRTELATQNASGPDSQQPTLVAFASQTGFGEELAEQAAGVLKASGAQVRIAALGSLTLEDLQGCAKLLLIASTCREGDAPDNARRFVDEVMRAEASLAELPYLLLALGDRHYAHFCAFGRQLDAWLQGAGASALAPCIEVDGADPLALCNWQHRLADIAQIDGPDTSKSVSWGYWRLQQRRLLNPGSVGAPVVEVTFEPVTGAGDSSHRLALPEWQAGDLLQLRAEGADSRPRTYSIASLPGSGAMQLLVRLHYTDADSTGLMSGLLCTEAPIGSLLQGRIRRNRNFQLGDNADRPLILIGNGTGLAGLMAHLRQRAQGDDGRNWLIFGERHAACDDFYHSELNDLEARDLLARCDRVFSRDPPGGEYVQHRLNRAQATLRDWVADGAAIYLCGNAVGMAPGVEQVLEDVLGTVTLKQLEAEGRLRRDVY
ncbi:MAG: oxidoreductase [Pseudomonadaceae bacterium]|nr:MAG: oxidoreductase [Pseudomonadaceae bacterium]